MAQVRGVSKSLFRLAVKTETDGMTFYTGLAERVADPLAKEMFKSLARDERQHLEVVRTLFAEAPPAQACRRFRRGMPATRLQTVFERMGRDRKRVPAKADEVDALRLALGMETASFELYNGEAQKTRIEAEKKLLRRLALEEHEHYEILSNSLSYLTDTGNWFIFTDHGNMDG